MNKSPAKLFLAYVIVGLISLLLIILLSRVLQNPDQAITIYLAIAITASNLLAVIGYTRAVLRDDELLSDQDAPDLAYYLGFSLTVGALSFSFLSDIWMSGHGTDAQKALIDRALVKGSLAQFGAGLLATLFGLSAKIYLASRQVKTQLDPDDLYRKFRIEVGSFSDLLRQVSSELNTNVKTAANDISEAGKSASQSFAKMAANIGEVTKTISDNLSQDKILLPVQKFTTQLETLSQPIIKFNKELELFVTSTAAVNDSIKSLNNDILKIDKSILEGSNSIEKFSSSVEISNTRVEVFSEKINNFSDANDKGVLSIQRLSSISENVTKDFEKLSSFLINFSESVKQANLSITTLSISIGEITSSCNGLQLVFNGLSEITAKSGSATAEFTNQIQLNSKIVSDYSNSLKSASTEAGLLTESVTLLIERFKSSISVTDQTTNSLNKMNDACLEISLNVIKLNSAAIEIAKKLEQVGNSLITISDGANPFGENLLRLANPLNEIKIKICEFSDAIGSAAAAARKINSA